MKNSLCEICCYCHNSLVANWASFKTFCEPYQQTSTSRCLSHRGVSTSVIMGFLCFPTHKNAAFAAKQTPDLLQHSLYIIYILLNKGDGNKCLEKGGSGVIFVKVFAILQLSVLFRSWYNPRHVSMYVFPWSAGWSSTFYTVCLTIFLHLLHNISPSLSIVT